MADVVSWERLTYGGERSAMNSCLGPVGGVYWACSPGRRTWRGLATWLRRWESKSGRGAVRMRCGGAAVAGRCSRGWELGESEEVKPQQAAGSTDLAIAPKASWSPDWRRLGQCESPAAAAAEVSLLTSRNSEREAIRIRV